MKIHIRWTGRIALKQNEDSKLTTFIYNYYNQSQILMIGIHLGVDGMNYNVFYKGIIVAFLIFVLLSSTFIVGYGGMSSKMPLNLQDKPDISIQSSRDIIDNNRMFNNFSAAGCNSTYINENRNVILGWESLQTQYEEDENTKLLCHFDDSYKGEDGELSVDYDKTRNGLIGWWRLDKGSGLHAYDSSVNNNIGNLQPNDPINKAKWTDNAMFGRALKFDGIDDNVDLWWLDTSYDNTWTWEFWLYDNSSTPSTRRWLSTTMDSFLSNTICIREQGGEILIYSGSGFAITSGHTWKNEWHYYTVVSDVSTVKVYEDGSQLLSTLPSTTIDPESGFFIGGGTITNTEFFNGTIDEVAIYDRAKSPTEVANDYKDQITKYRGALIGTSFENGKLNSGITITENDRLAYPIGSSPDTSCEGLWKFNEGILC